jgi:hypothetical protein
MQGRAVLYDTADVRRVICMDCAGEAVERVRELEESPARCGLLLSHSWATCPVGGAHVVQEADLPTRASLRSSDPAFTGDKTTAEYIDEVRERDDAQSAIDAAGRSQMEAEGNAYGQYEVDQGGPE